MPEVMGESPRALPLRTGGQSLPSASAVINEKTHAAPGQMHGGILTGSGCLWAEISGLEKLNACLSGRAEQLFIERRKRKPFSESHVQISGIVEGQHMRLGKSKHGVE
jgi:hypothetical protein